MFIIREYNNFGDEEPSYRNDILEYLYDIRDGINNSIDIMKAKAARIANGDTWTTINNRDKCVIDPVTHWGIRLSPKTAENDLMVINAIIEEVLGSDDEMFAVVWDCMDFHQMNPRLQVVKKTYIPVYPLKFDKKNTFKIPFETVLGGHVKFVTTWYGNMNLTNKFIELIEATYGDKLVGYRYEFIPEVWKDAYKSNRFYRINGKFYKVWFDEKSNELTLTDSSCQSNDVTAIELLRGKYDYTSRLSKDESGLLIPKLTIEMYESKEELKW